MNPFHPKLYPVTPCESLVFPYKLLQPLVTPYQPLSMLLFLKDIVQIEGLISQVRRLKQLLTSNETG